jgi:hypothetical protein
MYMHNRSKVKDHLKKRAAKYTTQSIKNEETFNRYNVLCLLFKQYQQISDISLPPGTLNVLLTTVIRIPTTTDKIM